MAMRRVSFVFLNILIFAASSVGRSHDHPNKIGLIRRADLECPEPTGEGICVENCTRDSNCTWPLKCCSNGCGHDCTVPITNADLCFYKGKMYRDGEYLQDECNTCNCRKGRVACTKMACNPKPGECPKPEIPGICILDCTSDWNCPPAEKCCSNGCGRVCTKPVKTGGSCFHKGNVYKNGETFKDVCNTCICTKGVVTCTLKLCPPKPGKCPTLEAEAPGICVLGCLSDWWCPGDEKCCGIDCSILCMKPVDGLSPGPNCTGVVCPELSCDYNYIPRGKCCSVCPPKIPSL